MLLFLVLKIILNGKLLTLTLLQGTFTLVIRRGDDTDNKPIVLESFTECSLDPLSDNYIARRVGDQYFEKDETDANNVVITTKGEFPNKSKYVRILEVNNQLYEYIGIDGNCSKWVCLSITKLQAVVLLQEVQVNTLGNNPLFGADGVADGAIQGLTEGDYDDAISILKNKDEYRFKTLIIPGLVQSIAKPSN